MVGTLMTAMALVSPPSSRKRVSISAAGVLALTVTGLLAAPQAAAAAAITCTTTDLIAAISAANHQLGGGTVTLAPGCGYTLTAVNNSTDGGTGLPVITGTVTIAGSGATITRSTAAGTPTFRLFDVATSGKLTLDSLTLSNGLLASNGSTGGAGVYNHGTLAVSATTFAGNSSPSPNGVSGGAISNSGRLTVTTSIFTGNIAQEGASIFNQNTTIITQTTFANNKATIYGGGGVLNGFGTTTVSSSTFVGNTGPGGGAIDNDTTMIVRNSTFYNNSDGGNGGGAVNNFGNITFIQSTLSGNKASTGANIHNFSYGSVTATVTLSMTIVDNGIGSSNCSSNGPPIIDNGYNLDSGSSCGLSSAKHSLSNTAPQLDALAPNGGPTQTMALAWSSRAFNAIPTSVSGCSGSTDQRGIARPQGSGCDIGAFEAIVSTTDTQPPTIPTGLSVTSVTASAVSLQWNASTDDVAVTGYTVYRNGTAVGSTGSAGATTYTDATVTPETTYSYRVDAVDAGALHSAQSPPLSVTTSAPPPGIRWTQAGTVGTGGSVTTTTLWLTSAVHAGDLLVGWFAQYGSTGQVQVSDNVNGAWTRGASETWSSTGDLALYYVQNAAAALSGVTITIGASTATYLEAAVSDYSGVALTGALDKAVVAKGVGTAADSGATAPTGAGELVVGGIITGGSPGGMTAGASQGQSFTIRAQTASGSNDIEDVLSSAAGAQNGRATLHTGTDWYAMGAVFHPYASADKQAPTVPAGLTATPSPSTPQVNLAWNASTDNVGVTGYTVYRNGSVLASVPGSTLAYTDNTVTSLATYSYAVAAFDAAANHSAQSSPVSVTTPDWTPPSVPAALAATVVSSGEIDLAWNASTDNVGVTGYTVYRNGAAIATTPGGTLTYADTAVGHGFTYTYTVDAFDAAANHSPQSASTSSTTPDDIPPTTPGSFAASATSPTAVVISWTSSTDNVGVAGYDVFRDGSVLITLPTSALNYTDTVATGNTHSYTVDAFDAAGNHSTTPPTITVTTSPADTTPPTVPTGLTAAAVGSIKVSLAWNASTDNVGVSGYTVYRNGAVLATVGASTLTYSDAAVTQATNYTYSIDAFDAAGNHSAQSATASVHVPGIPKFVQSAVGSTGTTVTRMTLTLGPVARGDILVGWFGQYNSTGQVTVSDSVNGAWTRSASTAWSGGTAPGDIALYYLANSAAAPSGLTITIATTSATYIQGGAAEYSGVSTVNPLDQVVIASGSSTSADSGLTAAVGPGELVYGGITATNGPGTLTAGTSQGVAFATRAQTTSGSQGEEDITSSAAGQQHAGFTFPTSTQWFTVCAVFKPA
jgi:fibronectin type 3 domain-containing protein